MDRDELAELLPGEFPGLVRYAQSMVGDPHHAEDLAADTCIRALERAESFRGDAKLATWLHRILHNLAVDRVRQRREFPSDVVADEVERRWRDNSYTVDASVVVGRAETAQELRDALIRVPYAHRAAVVLHDAEGMTAAEIAAIFGIGLPAAKQRIRRGRMMLVSALAAGAERREEVRGLPLTCWEARRHVSDYLDGDVAPGTAAAVEKHLANCPTCPALYHSLVATRGALAGGAAARRDPDSTIPPAVLARIRRRTAAGDA